MGGHDVGVLSMYGGRGDLEPLVGLAVQLRTFDAEVRGVRRPTERSGRPTRAREGNGR
jgi:hypothetical protein